MGRRLAAAWLVFMIWFATGMLAAPASQAISTTTGSFADRFDSQSYAGNDGTREWTGPWSEIGESDGPAIGGVEVKKGGNCPGSWCLRLSEALAAEAGAARHVDLEGAIVAKLTFGYLQKGTKGEGAMYVVVSADGGATWRTIGIYAESQSASVSLDITQYANAETVIAFVVDAEMPGNTFIDYVTITAEFGVVEPTTTTTTEPPPTTTTAPPNVAPPPVPDPTPPTTQPPVVTTTTVPHPTTTTTTPPPPTTTTTPPPTTTTTTPPPPTTTTTPPPTTTTTTTTPEGTPTSTPTTIPPPSTDDAVLVPVSDANATAAAAHIERFNLAVVGLMDPVMAAPSTEEAALRERRGPLTEVLGTLTTSGGALRSQLIPGVVLGSLIAWTAVAGLGRREDDEQVI